LVYFFPSYLQTVYNSNSAQLSIYYGIIILICGTASCLLGGYLATRQEAGSYYMQKSFPMRQMVAGVGTLVSAPLLVLCAYVHKLYPTTESGSTEARSVALATLALATLAGELWYGPVISLIAEPLSAKGRTMALAFYHATSTAVGFIGPDLIVLIVRGISTSDEPYPYEIREVLIPVVCFGILFSGALFLFSSGWTRYDDEVKTRSAAVEARTLAGELWSGMASSGKSRRNVLLVCYSVLFILAVAFTIISLAPDDQK
jgi:hypothetical protein